VFENGGLTGYLDLRKEGTTHGSRQFHKEWLHDVNSSANITTEEKGITCTAKAADEKS
jgi:hypothetical protein